MRETFFLTLIAAKKHICLFFKLGSFKTQEKSASLKTFSLSLRKIKKFIKWFPILSATALWMIIQIIIICIIIIYYQLISSKNFCVILVDLQRVFIYSGLYLNVIMNSLVRTCTITDSVFPDLSKADALHVQRRHKALYFLNFVL